MAKIMNRAFEDNPSRYIDKLYDMSLNQPLGLEIKGEPKPFIKHPSDKQLWWGTSLTVLSYGYELKVTPLQMLTFYNAVANNGKMVKPLFVTEIREGVAVKDKFEPVVINKKIASDETIMQARSLLEGVVLRGTGKNVFKDTPYSVAGKTGTAKIASGGGYSKSYNASFAGYFPADDPKYSCIVAINRPTNGKYYGGSVAAPAFKEIADKLYSTMMVFELQMAEGNNQLQLPETKHSSDYETLKTIYAGLGLNPSDYLHNEKWAVVEKREDNLAFESVEFDNTRVPDVKGMRAKDAVYLLENMGMKTVLTGRGQVKSQSIKAGSKVNSGQTIKLQLAVY
jgi:cell division protein FtsI (penicillin-binding protein 3)